MGICLIPFQSECFITAGVWKLRFDLSQIQLPDSNAKNFSPAVLQQAMLDTIATLNEFSAEAGIAEVCSLFLHNIGISLSFSFSSLAWWTSV